MGKIRLQDLAKMMGVPPQDLMFKLKSIGVRVEGEDAHIDTDIIQAILQGKKLPHPREVILRDEPTQAEAASPAARRRRPAARRPSPLRPKRRNMIRKVDSDIQTLPSKDKPTPEEKAVAEMKAKEAAEEKAAAEKAAEEKAAREAAAEAEAERKAKEEAMTAEERKKAAAKRAKEEEEAAKARKEAERKAREAAKAPIPEPVRVSSPPPEFGEKSAAEKKAKKKKKDKEAEKKAKADKKAEKRAEAEERKGKKKPAAAKKEAEEDKKKLRTHRGKAAKDVAEEESEATRIAAARRKRRAERRQRGREEAEVVQVAGRSITFAEGRPQDPVLITEGMTVREFADKLGVKSKDLIALLVSRGIMANINQVLEPEAAAKLAEEMEVETMEVSIEEEVQLRQEQDSDVGAEGAVHRGPVVTIMGHVDHGKTSLLDAIRESRVTEGEHGGITQHIGAYQVTKSGKKIVFLDTPGHEAFTTMRARGAGATDIVVLVVAADDGVMPQTVEAIDHARAAEVPLVVAINKVDKANANMDRVKKELADHELLVEDWGGDTVAVPISALKRTGIDELLEMILLTADLLELKGNPDLPAQGVVLEARKEAGRGTVATVLVQNGTLRVGDAFVSGAAHGRVRAMTNDLGERVEEAEPATPVEVSGFQDVPEAGDVFQVMDSESEARDIASYRQQEARRRELQPTAGRMSLEQLYDKIEEGEIKELPVVLKADVQGSVEVLKDTLHKLGTDQVRVKVIHSQVGAISTNDVILATASDAIILGFNVRPERKASEMAEAEGIDIRLHTVIYELTDELKKAMAGLLEPEFKEVVEGHAEVRDTFKVPKIGIAAGCHVTDGTVSRNSMVRLLRDNVVVYDGKVASLRRFKDDVGEVRAGFECGIGLERFQDIKPGDVLEAYRKEEVAAEL